MAEEHTLPPSEIDLIRKAQTGDRLAFIQLYREHAGHIYAVCLRMLANPSRANELTQETIIHAWQTLSSFRGESPFSAWIHRIAVHAVLDHLRSQKRLAARVHFTDDLDPFDSQEHSSPAGTALDIEGAIASLPPQARAILILHDIEGYNHEEIGEMMSIAPGTSKAHLHRARILMKERLQQ